MAEKRKHIPPRVRREIYEKYGGRCAYCGNPIQYEEMEIDHLIPLRNGGADDVTNYMPACRPCNFYKGTSTIERFRGNLQTLTERLEKVYIYRLALRYKIVTQHGKEIKFYYEQYDYEECET